MNTTPRCHERFRLVPSSSLPAINAVVFTYPEQGTEHGDTSRAVTGTAADLANRAVGGSGDVVVSRTNRGIEARRSRSTRPAPVVS